MILAIVFKSPVAYLAAFAGGFAREAGDLVQELAKDEPSTGVIIGVIVFMLLCAVGDSLQTMREKYKCIWAALPPLFVFAWGSVRQHFSSKFLQSQLLISERIKIVL